MFRSALVCIALAGAAVACSSDRSLDGAGADASSVDSSADSTPDSSTDTAVSDPPDTVTDSVAPSTTTATTTPAQTTQPTTPPATTVPKTIPPFTTLPNGPRLTTATFTVDGACPPPPNPDASFVPDPVDPPVVKMSWVAVNSDSVYIAIGNPEGPYAQDLPTTGSYEINYNCGGAQQTYYIVAVKGAQKDVKQKKL